MVSALLSGALLNCAFLAILRVARGLVAAGLGAFSRELLIVLRAGLDGGGRGVHHRPDRLQADAGLFERRAHGHPRARASASAAWPASARMLHAVNHSLTKAMLFLAGRATSWPSTAPSRPRRSAACCGPCRSPACSGWPGSWRSPARRRSGLFLSELTILKGALRSGADRRGGRRISPLLARRLRRHGDASSCAWPTAARAGRAADPERSRSCLGRVVPPRRRSAAVVLALGRLRCRTGRSRALTRGRGRQLGAR